MEPKARERGVRSDSTRNRDAILAAAARCLTENPSATLADIAQAAGIGRVTLYGHFPSRSELLTALLHTTMVRVETQLSAIDLSGSPWEAMDTLATTSWRVLSEVNTLRGVVEQELPEAEMHASHDDPRTRLIRLLERGRADGSFRRDQGVDWQVACYFSILHGAASEIRAGRLTEEDVQTLLPATLRSLLQASPE